MPTTNLPVLTSAYCSPCSSPPTFFSPPPRVVAPPTNHLRHHHRSPPRLWRYVGSQPRGSLLRCWALRRSLFSGNFSRQNWASHRDDVARTWGPVAGAPQHRASPVCGALQPRTYRPGCAAAGYCGRTGWPGCSHSPTVLSDFVAVVVGVCCCCTAVVVAGGGAAVECAVAPAWRTADWGGAAVEWVRAACRPPLLSSLNKKRN